MFDKDDFLNQVVARMTAVEREFRAKHDYPWEDSKHCWRWEYPGKRWLYINSDGGTQGAFLVEAATGEIYNIQGYGVPDHNKKKKADLGNLFKLDLSDLEDFRWLYSKRFNYLR